MPTACGCSVAVGTPVCGTPCCADKALHCAVCELLTLIAAEATTLLGSHAQLHPPKGGFDDAQAYHLLLKMLQKKPADRIEAALISKHSYLAGGVDTVEMEASFGPMQKGHLFLRSLLSQMRQPGLHPAR